MNNSTKLVKILQEMINIMSSGEKDERIVIITSLYNRVKKAEKKELSDIGREILQLCRGGMGSFFDIGAGRTEAESIKFFKLSDELFNAALEVIK